MKILSTEEKKQLILEFYKFWLEKATSCNSVEWITDRGLCVALWVWYTEYGRALAKDAGHDTYKELSLHLKDILPSPDYPFNTDSYEYALECDNLQCHINPFRIAHIRKFLQENQ